jgi:hypothetical protein
LSHRVEALAFWSHKVARKIKGVLEREARATCRHVRQGKTSVPSRRPLTRSNRSLRTIISRPVVDGFTTEIAESSLRYTRGEFNSCYPAFSALVGPHARDSGRIPRANINACGVAHREVHVKTCPDCNGDGVIEKGTDGEQQCPTCGGSGFVPDDDNVEEVIRTASGMPPVCAACG